MARYNNHTQADYSAKISVLKASLNCDLGTYPDCRDFNIGGIQKLFFADFRNLGYAFLNADGTVKAFENPLVTEWVYIPFNVNNPTIETKTEISATGTRFTSTLTAAISLQTNVRRSIFLQMVNGRFGCLALDLNGTFWLLGNQNPFRVTENTKSIGAAGTDFNGDAITMVTNQTYPPRVLSDEAITDLNFSLFLNCINLAGSPAFSPLPLLALADCELDLFSTMIL